MTVDLLGAAVAPHPSCAFGIDRAEVTGASGAVVALDLARRRVAART